jgi:hypothetical protein
LRPSAVYFRGEPHLIKSRGLLKTSGFNVPITSSDLGDSSWKQCLAAASFLRRHRAELKRLRRFGFKRAVLDFGLHDRATKKHPWPSYALSRQLIALAGEYRLDIELSFYGPSNGDR